MPAFLFCGRMETGFDRAETTGALLLEALEACRARAEAGLPLVDGPRDFALAGFGFDPRGMSLPVMTVVLALLDSFNPCAFFVLFFLLSLLARAGGRRRMLLVGGLFVAVSGAVYFLFMNAWLNLFLVIGKLHWITLAAGLVALTIALLDIKDFFLLGHGPTASIPEGAKPGLFRRMRTLVGAERLPAVLLATLVLAVSANSYELLCTAGFPMVFTRLLTLEGGGSYTFYLVLYNLIYVLPMLLIVIAFAMTLGARKLTEEEGRGLKLISGLMLLELGLVLLFAPQLLSSLQVAAGLVVSALLVGWALYRWRLRRVRAAAVPGGDRLSAPQEQKSPPRPGRAGFALVVGRGQPGRWMVPSSSEDFIFFGAGRPISSSTVEAMLAMPPPVRRRQGCSSMMTQGTG